MKPPHQTRPHRQGRHVLLATATAIMLATTGCDMTDPYHPTSPADSAQAAETLKTLPSLEYTEAQVHATIEHIGAQATAISPSLNWYWHREPSRGGCLPPYEQSGGEEILMDNYVSDTPIPEESWAQIFAIARDAATKLGATGLEVFKDAPGDHDVRFYNQTGTAIRLGSWKAALITGSTGCRLPRDKK